MKQKRYWLRGGVIGLIISLLIMIVLLVMFDSAVPCSNIAGAYCPQGWSAIMINVQNSFRYSTNESVITLLKFILIPTLSGLIIGWIYGLIKNRGRMVSQ